MVREWICSDPGELGMIARELLDTGSSEKIWIFEGELGAGKTTLIKALCGVLGVVDMVSSPSFSLINEYRTAADATIYHFDFYRIKNEMEAVDIGADEYFYSGDQCFVEWPSKIPSLIPDKYLKISINLVLENQRKITLETYG